MMKYGKERCPYCIVLTVQYIGCSLKSAFWKILHKESLMVKINNTSKCPDFTILHTLKCEVINSIQNELGQLHT